MISKFAYLKIILTASCLFAANQHAVAEEEMEEDMLEEEVEALPELYTRQVELGILYNSEDSFKFGEYSGLEDEGVYAIGNFLVRKKSAIHDDDKNYWELSGTNLGLDSRSFFGEYSHDGTFGNYSHDRAYSVFVFYDQLPHNQLDDARTAFVGTGSNMLTLPPAYANTGSGTAGISFNGTLHTVEVETERQTVGGGFSLSPFDGWKLTGKYQHQFKDGTETAGISTDAFSNAFVAIIPVEYDFDEFDLKLSHVGNKGYFDLGYHLSVFENDNSGLLFENPFQNSGNNPLRQQQQRGLEPDNHSHTVTFAGGYNLGHTAVATANLSYQRMIQDDTFLPYTVNTSFLPLPFAELPRNSLDGVINNWFANFTLTGRPTRKLSLTGRYTFDYRDSDTPSNTYQYVRTDAAAQQDVDSSRARVNKVYDFERHKAELDANFRLIPRVTLAAGYEFEYVNRDNSEVEQTYEHTGKVRLTASPTDNTHTWIKYLHADKHGDNYDNTAPFFAGFSQQHIDDVAVNDCGDPAGGPYNLNCSDYYENSGFIRKFYMADRERDQVAGNLSFFPDDRFTIGFTGRYTTDDYDESDLGLTDRDVLTFTVDMSYMSSKDFTAYAYYTHDYINNDQVGCEACDPLPPPNGNGIEADHRWEVSNEDRVNTFGTGFEWKNILPDKLDLFVDFVYTKALTEVKPIVPGNFVDPGILPFPDIETRIFNVSLRGDYRWNKQTRVRFSYLYEYFSNDDWAFDNVDPTTIDRILATGERSPDYNAHVFGVSLIYDF